MDVDWCLSCERKLDDLPGPYCSMECLSYAQPPSDARIHPLPLPDSGVYRIRQWAQAIPPHIPAGAPAKPFADLDLAPPSQLPSDRPHSPRPRQPPTPKLIERTAASTPLPTLCISSPAQVRPPHPLRASSQTYARPPGTTTSMSEASTSLTSLLSEPMVATPDEDASFGANIGALVRSWVNYDRAKCAKEDYVIEKVTDYFPSLPHGKKPSFSPSSSKKSKQTLPPSPAPVYRHRHYVNKVVPFVHRDRSTRSHTPTPVIFPSCRAAELDWVDGEDEDEDEDEMAWAPQPQYRPTYHQKYEPQPQFEPVHWTRAPSLSSSVSSSDSSVLLMATKRAARAIAA